MSGRPVREPRTRLPCVADALHDEATIDDGLHDRLVAEFTEVELLDIYLLCGWYHAISSAVVEREPDAPAFGEYRIG